MAAILSRVDDYLAMEQSSQIRPIDNFVKELTMKMLQYCPFCTLFVSVSHIAAVSLCRLIHFTQAICYRFVHYGRLLVIACVRICDQEANEKKGIACGKNNDSTQIFLLWMCTCIWRNRTLSALVQCITFTIHNSQHLYCLPTYKLYDTQRKYTNNILLTYSYIYFNDKPILWEQRELEIIFDLWAPCLIHLTSFISTRVQGVQGCNSDNTVITQ